MSGKVLFDGIGPRTQAADAVKAMIEFLDGEPCQKMPRIVVLANGWQLTKSSKGDEYYLTSARECSCPGFFHHRSCKHVKPLTGQASAPEKEQLIDAHAFETEPQEIDYWQKKEEQQPEKLSSTQRFARDIVAAMET